MTSIEEVFGGQFAHSCRTLGGGGGEDGTYAEDGTRDD